MLEARDKRQRSNSRNRLSLEEAMKRQDQEMIDSKLQIGENSQTVVIDCGHPQSLRILQDALGENVKHKLRIRIL